MKQSLQKLFPESWSKKEVKEIKDLLSKESYHERVRIAIQEALYDLRYSESNITTYAKSEEIFNQASDLFANLGLDVLESLYVKETNNPAERVNRRLKIQDRNSYYSREYTAFVHRFRRVRVDAVTPYRDPEFYHFIGVPI